MFHHITAIFPLRDYWAKNRNVITRLPFGCATGTGHCPFRGKQKSGVRYLFHLTALITPRLTVSIIKGRKYPIPVLILPERNCHPSIQQPWYSLRAWKNTGTGLM